MRSVSPTGGSIVHRLDTTDCLQLIGDGLLAALSDRVEGAAELAADCARAARERGWSGDDELADQLSTLREGGTRRCGRCRWTSRSSPASSRAIRCRVADTQRFIDLCPDPELADRLDVAIQGRGAFRRFRDVLARSPAELERFFAFADERQRGRAREWLEAEGYPVARGTCSERG